MIFKNPNIQKFQKLSKYYDCIRKIFSPTELADGWPPNSAINLSYAQSLCRTTDILQVFVYIIIFHVEFTYMYMYILYIILFTW